MDLGWSKDDPFDAKYNLRAIEVPTGISLDQFKRENNIQHAAILGKGKFKDAQLHKVDIVFSAEDDMTTFGFMSEGVKGRHGRCAVAYWEPEVELELSFFILGMEFTSKVLLNTCVEESTAEWNGTGHR